MAGVSISIFSSGLPDNLYARSESAGPLGLFRLKVGGGSFS